MTDEYKEKYEGALITIAKLRIELADANFFIDHVKQEAARINKVYSNAK